MTVTVLETKGFAAAVIDALAEHICVIDRNGVIVSVNRAWREFAIDNPPVSNRTGVGTDYLDVCSKASGPGSEGAEQFASGIRAVLDGRSELFEMEYPCHSPTENRWFLGHVTPLESGHRGAVISHTAITERKLLEFKLLRMAETDSLTGLTNRGYFRNAANLEVGRVNRFGSVASIVMIDLDRFKSINDTYGHPAGDEVLRCFAETCSKPLRQIDVFARIGGEEFVILLPGTDEAGAVYVAEKLRAALCEMTVESGQKQFGITASFGVAQIRSGDASIDACLVRADKALYAAKQAGRDRVIRSSAVPREEQKPAA